MKIRNLIIPCFALLLSLTLCITVFAYTGNGATIVYVTATGDKYHTSSCGYLSRSKFPIALEDAIVDNYTRCSRCLPPIYTGLAKSEISDNKSNNSLVDNISSATQFASTASKHYIEGAGSENHNTRNGSKSSGKTAAKTAPKDFSPDLTTIFVIVLLIVLNILLIYHLGIYLFKKTNWYKIIVLNRKKAALCADLSKILSKYQSYVSFRNSSQFKICINLRQEKEKALGSHLSAHDCHLDENGYLVNNDARFAYGMDFTVYPGSKRYHRRSCHHCAGGYSHISNVYSRLLPCKICHPPIYKPWMEDCLKLHKQIEEIDVVLNFPFSSDYLGDQTYLDVQQSLSSIISTLQKISFSSHSFNKKSLSMPQNKLSIYETAKQESAAERFARHQAMIAKYYEQVQHPSPPPPPPARKSSVDYIYCPKCNTKQRSNRTRCFECGIVFAEHPSHDP